jgi:S-layer protein
LTSTTVSKALALGTGDDTLNLASGTTSMTAIVDGGAGTDTLGMASSDAASASTNNLFMSKFTGFEKLSLGKLVDGASDTVDLSNMNGLNYVASAGTGITTSEVQTVTVTGNATAAVTFLGTAIASSVSGDTPTLTAGRITTDKAALISAWNTANPTKELLNISNSGATITLTYKNTEGDVAVVATTTSAGATFGASVETTKGSIDGALTLTKMANNGTLELTAAGTGATVTMTDATGTSDSFNLVTKVGSSDIGFGTVAAAGVETVNITATDTSPVNTTTGAATISKATLTLSDAVAKTVVITGNSDLDLTASGAALTTVNGSAFTGKLSFSSAVDNAVITGGSAADTLTATGSGQTLNGGAGADTLVVTGNLATLIGGAGNDAFDVSDATSNVNNYATIADVASGDAIKFNANSTAFAAAKVTLADTAVFQDYANTAIANSAQYTVSWFQYNGNTYVVQDVSNSTTTFTNGTDLIVKIAGLVDLSTATFNTSTDTLYI